MRVTMLIAAVLCCTMLFAAEHQDDGQEVSLQLFIPSGDRPPYVAYPLVVAVTNHSKEALDFSERMLCMEEAEFRAKPMPLGTQLVLVFETPKDLTGGGGGSLRIPPYKGVQIAPGETGLVLNHISPQVIRRSGNRVRILALRDGKVVGSTDWSPAALQRK